MNIKNIPIYRQKKHVTNLVIIINYLKIQLFFQNQPRKQVKF